VRTHFSLLGAVVSALALLVSILSFPPVHTGSGAEALLMRSWASVTSVSHHSSYSTPAKITQPAARSGRS
jgi:hypothetical protein